MGDIWGSIVTEKIGLFVVTGGADDDSNIVICEKVDNFFSYETDVRKPGNCFVGGQYSFASGGDSSTHMVCPKYSVGDYIYCLWDGEFWHDINVDARSISPKSSIDSTCGDIEDPDPESCSSSVGGVGPPGISGIAADGEHGDKGEKGQVGAPGDAGQPGQKGPKGNKGADGQKGYKGDDGEKGGGGDVGQPGVDGEDGDPVDLGSGAIVIVDGVTYGARLIGVCVDGGWEYVYIFASTPQ
tara:strand:- start:33 stop:755 length:723 start_codon:yes stop_codon:yes gene_type:complete